MAKLSIQAGLTSKTINIFIQDSRSASGAGLTGLVFNTAGLTAYYALPLAASVAISLVTLAAVTTAYASGGFKEIDATNMPGWYRLDLPNAAIASGTFVGVHLQGAANMVPLPLEIELTAWNNQDSVRGGMTALPNAAAAASGGLIINGSNTGTVTLAAFTCTGSLTISDGLAVTRSTSNSNAASFTGNGTGSGIVAISGAGATGDGFQATSNATNGNGSVFTGKGTGTGFVAQGGITGRGANLSGGATSGAGLGVTGSGASPGVVVNAGATGNAVNLVGGATSGIGLNITTTSGDGVSITPTAGSAIVATANGTSKYGIVATGGTAGTSDGIKAVAGTGGVDFRANQTGDRTGNVSGSVGSVTAGVTLAASAVQAVWDALTSALTTVGSIGKLLVTNIDAAVSSRMATYTQPTGFLAATFPGTVASTSNITAGTITTVTNLTNAPTAGDFTATMKTSLNAATPAVTVSDKTGFALTSAYDFAKGTVAMTESYAAQGAALTPVQALYGINQQMGEQGIVGTLMTVKKRDRSATAKTFTLNDATTPTAITEAS